MSKAVFVLELPDPKIRKKHAPPGKVHNDASKYSRKCKHKARREEAPGNSGSFFYWQNRGAGLDFSERAFYFENALSPGSISVRRANETQAKLFSPAAPNTAFQSICSRYF